MPMPLDMSTDAAVGVVNFMRTGSIIFDMFIAMLIPFVFRSIVEKKILSRLSTYVFSLLESSQENVSIRTISFMHISGRAAGSNAFDSKNEMLQKALTLYFTVSDAKVDFSGKAQVALTSLNDGRWQHERPDRYNPLANYKLTWLAPEGEWVEVDAAEPGLPGSQIEFRQLTNSQPSGESTPNAPANKEQLVFELRCSAVKHGGKRIDALIERAVAWYKEELLKQRDEARYLYVMKHAPTLWGVSNSDKDGDDATKYKRYKLSDHKRFDSLFFPAKDSLLRLLDDFTNKAGKYAVSGYPHKLGVLLHGPPGTGKTSLIKALAHATNRSIINVPLSQIGTNQQLMDVMYDLKLKVDGGDQHPTGPCLDFKDVIFVIEDVDCASKIVRRRDCEPPPVEPVGLSAEHVRTLASSLASSSRSSMSPCAGGDGDDGPAAAAGGGSPGANGCGEATGKVPVRTLSEQLGELVKPRPDELSLAGLLNVLDGVVDTPGRLLILTSNHPEQLDPALIRPGRVDRLIYLGHLQSEAAEQMLAHYFNTPLTPAQREKLDATLSAEDAMVTPAMLEQLCARYETVDELLEGLQAHLEAEGSRLDGHHSSKVAKVAVPTATATVPAQPPQHPSAPPGSPFEAVEMEVEVEVEVETEKGLRDEEKGLRDEGMPTAAPLLKRQVSGG